MTEPAPLSLAQAPVLVVTRFSFVGQSGWKSDASRDPALLFDEDRLWTRLQLFSTVTLPSLAAQTDPDFHHLILTSDQLPPWALEELTDCCLYAYGDRARFTILAEPPGIARRVLRLYMERTYPDAPLIVQVVLDDDDGLAMDYMEDLRAELAVHQAETPDFTAHLPYFISFSEGYGLMIRDTAADQVAFYRHRYPCINLGLALIGTPRGKNIFAIDHLAAPRKYGVRLINRKPMFMRAVHDFNDSRVAPTGNWKPLADWRADPDLANRFSWLHAPEAAWNEDL